MELTRVDASLYNPDLAPIPPERRTWGTYNYASLWVAMSVCIPTYMLASGLIAGGMSWMSGGVHDSAGQSDRVDSHAAERACRYALRHTISCIRSRIVWRARGECSRGPARAGGLRMVWHSDMDWRASDLLDAAHCVAGRGKCAGEQLDLLLCSSGRSICT